MKKLKRIIASASAAAMAASALLAAVPASAASVEKEIAYTGPSDGALAFENDGSSLRMNIFNEWGIDIKDIENKGDFSEKISVTFTVSGLGENSANIAEDGTETPYEAFLSDLSEQIPIGVRPLKEIPLTISLLQSRATEHIWRNFC